MTRPTRRRRRPVQSDDDVREIADERPTRSRRRRSVQVEDEQDEDRPSRRRSRFADDADEYDEMPRRRASVDDSHDESRLWSVPWMPSICCRKAMRSATIRVR